MKDHEFSFGGGLAYLFCFVALCVASALWSGYVLATVWQWFAVPTFGLPALAMPAAIGLSLLASLLTHQVNYSKTEKSGMEYFWSVTTMCAIRPAVILLSAWITRYWMAT